jgi:CO dehydrogenase/acetyl-CoA synthase beta subunit
MDIFDDCIRQVKDWFRRKEDAGQARRFEPNPSRTIPDVNDRRKDEKATGIIFKEDTRLELGHPSEGSCAATLATNERPLVEGGRITLVGPDIGETDRPKLPFAQITLAYTDGNLEDTCSAMDRILHSSAQTDGYMLRSVPNMIWARVSNRAADAGFSLVELGSRLIGSLNANCAGIGGVDIFFATTAREDIAELNEIVAPARNQLRKLQTFGRREDGSYECDTSLDCNECPEKAVCDTIRDVITIRKGDRIITFGGDESKTA